MNEKFTSWKFVQVHTIYKINYHYATGTMKNSEPGNAQAVFFFGGGWLIMRKYTAKKNWINHIKHLTWLKYFSLRGELFLSTNHS